jgi:hypothetical protein
MASSICLARISQVVDPAKYCWCNSVAYLNIDAQRVYHLVAISDNTFVSITGLQHLSESSNFLFEAPKDIISAAVIKPTKFSSIWRFPIDVGRSKPGGAS